MLQSEKHWKDRTETLRGNVFVAKEGKGETDIEVEAILLCFRPSVSERTKGGISSSNAV